MKDSRKQPFALALFSYFTIGCMVLTANTVLKSLIDEFHWTDSQGGLLISFMSIGNLVMSLVGNLLMEKTGRRGAMLLYSGMVTGSFALFAISPSPVTFYPLILIAGFAWGGVNSLVNTIVSEMYNGSSSRLNVMHACYATGAVLFPLLVGFITMSGLTWRIPVALVAALGVALLVFSALTPLPGRKILTAGDGHRVEVKFWKELGFYLGVICFFTYVGVETAASSWLSSFLSQQNSFFRQVPSETMVSLMWLTMIVGRLTFAAIGTRIDKTVLLISLSGGFLLGMLGIIFLSGNTVLAILSVAFMGLSMSAMYATCVANSARYIACSAVAPGILFGAGGLGSAVIPFVAGIVSDARGMKSGMISLCVFLAILLAAAILTMMTRPAKGSRL